MQEDALIGMLEVQRDCTARFLAELKRDPSRANALDLIRRAQCLSDEIDRMLGLTVQDQRQ
jgi:hypothetical protein